jgi:hypothetical protein
LLFRSIDTGFHEMKINKDGQFISPSRYSRNCSNLSHTESSTGWYY